MPTSLAKTEYYLWPAPAAKRAEDQAVTMWKSIWGHQLPGHPLQRPNIISPVFEIGITEISLRKGVRPLGV